MPISRASILFIVALPGYCVKGCHNEQKIAKGTTEKWISQPYIISFLKPFKASVV